MNLTDADVIAAFTGWERTQRYPKTWDPILGAIWLDSMERHRVTREEFTDAAKLVVDSMAEFPTPSEVIAMVKKIRAWRSDIPVIGVQALASRNPLEDPTEEEIQRIRERTRMKLGITLEDPEQTQKVKAQILELKQSRMEA